MITATPHPDSSKTKVQMSLVGVDSHALSIVGAFKRNATRQGFNKDWIVQVRKKALSGSYEELINTISEYIED